ncbi:MAG TPA: type ISP restriction/modification enzyme [Pirellulaceae bacterium]|nr:type ISP restriction/modification enzyme [Pirellulaceae bacterium]
MPRARRTQRGSERLAMAAAEATRYEITHGASPEAARRIVCCQVASALLPITLTEPIAAWIAHQAGELWQWQPPRAELRQALAAASSEADPLANFYEAYLHAFDGEHRLRRGVYYTPRAIVRFIVRAVDAALRDEFGLRDGLADVTIDERTGLSFARVLDPALGAGLFLTEIIEHVQQACVTQWRAEGGDAAEISERWNAYVPRHLLPRLGGIEIIPEAACLAVARIARTLAATGYRFENAACFQLHVADALAQPIRPAWNIIVGNPPFSGISATKQHWAQELLQGRGLLGEVRASYFQVNGQPLGERKHWLQDDYVKFLRIAHEQIETTGRGMVALVTSHGYLDNVTFRGLREKLTQTFERITVVDLHGNAKRKERTPDDERDENVFGIEQGVAIGLLRATGKQPAPPVERADLWGTREQKLALLEQASVADLAPQPVEQTQPGQAFVLASGERFPEYEAGWPLPLLFPFNSTAPVTARDAFVVGWTDAQLLERCRDLADETLSDDELRARYFHRTRSRTHAPGDSRGWKLSQARATMRTTVDPGSLIATFQYRPFDYRPLLWADWLVDWPRSEMMFHVCAADNLSLIARRQSPPGSAGNYVWATACGTLDGVIRSDNCGSESLFPLWIDGNTTRRANINEHFVRAFAQASGLSWSMEGDAHDIQLFTAVTLFQYVYALLFCPLYRQRYAARLMSDFPRVLLPSSGRLFHQLSDVGRELLDCHLLRNSERAGEWRIEGAALVAPGMPKFAAGRVRINETCYCEGVSRDAWEFHVGSHRVLQKYLKDRRTRVLTPDEVLHYQRMVAAVDRTLVLQAALDGVIQEHGGFEQAFYTPR